LKDFKFSRLWLTAGWLLILLVVFFSLSPKPPEVIEFEQGDKFGRLVAYLSLMLWFANIYPGRKQRISLSLAFFAMGAILEFLQGLSGYRTFQYSDIVANSMGILFGWLLAKTWSGTFLAKLDKLLQRVSLNKAEF
jgi:glycopeptide antibiotics resistance protein